MLHAGRLAAGPDAHALRGSRRTARSRRGRGVPPKSAAAQCAADLHVAATRACVYACVRALSGQHEARVERARKAAQSKADISISLYPGHLNVLKLLGDITIGSNPLFFKLISKLVKVVTTPFVCGFHASVINKIFFIYATFLFIFFFSSNSLLLAISAQLIISNVPS